MVVDSGFSRLGPLSAADMSERWIRIEGAREHNLKDISISLPRNRLVVITGLSGSGKSSLAFDTLYAEGQRKYVESLSGYARQFLGRLKRPDVDRIEGLSPAIAIEQRTTGGNPRSTVATTTEIYDHFRVLYAAVGVPHCHRCGRVIEPRAPQEICSDILRWPEGTRVTLLVRVVAHGRGEYRDVLERLRREGFVRARIDGEIADLDEVRKLARNRFHDVDVVIDRLVLREGVRSRLADSVELAIEWGEGTFSTLRREPGGASEIETVHSVGNACTHCGISYGEFKARHFSFNSPEGACPVCHGLGTALSFDERLVIPNPELPLRRGAVAPWRRGGRRLVTYYNRLLRAVARHYGVDYEKTPWEGLPEDFRRVVLHGSGEEEIEFTLWRGGKNHRYRKPFEGVLPNLERRYRETSSPGVRRQLEPFMARRPCPECGGTRLRPEIRAVTVGDCSIVDVVRMTVAQALAWIDGLQLDPQRRRIASELVEAIRARLGFLRDVGLDYLTLDRESGTLSGGEGQRIRLATQIGAGLVGVLYILDEPSIGLHPRDQFRLIDLMKRLRDMGNTVVVVEHDPDTIRSADYVVDLGPGAGRLGGRIVAHGPLERFLASSRSSTARYLRGESRIPVPSRRIPVRPRGPALVVEGARANNLRNLTVRFPLGVFCCVTGVSGSGKSTLVDDVLRRALARRLHGSSLIPGEHDRIRGVERVDKVVVVDQSPIGRTPRSNPATYLGVFDEIRKLYSRLPASRVRGYGPGRFSFNVKGGRCEACRGDGMIRVEMHFLPDVYVECEVCRGRRYNRETLEVTYKGRNIADVLEMTVDEAFDFFRAIPRIQGRLRTMTDVGLGYLQLGQPATTLSGGEAQRLKLAGELSRRATGHTVYILDEPTTGLHFADVQRLLEVLLRLRDAGNTLIVIEHNLDVIKTADHVIDLGPEGGDGGGRIVVTGTPEDVAACRDSHTGAFLARVLEKDREATG